jgi:hypothetical protein
VEVGVRVGVGDGVDVGVGVERRKGRDEHPRVSVRIEATSGTMPAGFRLMRGTPLLW